MSRLALVAVPACGLAVLVGCVKLEVDPTEIDFGYVADGDSRASRVRVENTGQGPTWVTGVRAHGSPRLTATWKGSDVRPILLNPDDTLEIDVLWRPLSEGNLSGDVTIEMSDVPAIVVPVLGVTDREQDIAVWNPQLPLLGTSGWDAGLTESDLHVMVYNAGRATLEVGQLAITGVDAARFVLHGDSVSNTSFDDEGPTRSAYVRFTPAEPGVPVSAALEIPSNDPDENPLVVPLRGGAAIPPVARCGVGQSVAPLSEVTLDGTESYDPGGQEPLAYHWVLQTPPGSAAVLDDPGIPTPSFTPDLVGHYSANLTVWNQADQASTDPCETDVEVASDEGLRVEMFWTLEFDDIDLHLLRTLDSEPESADDCFYANCKGAGLPWWGDSDPANDPVLDLDDITGTGPETITIADPVPSVYAVLVHDFETNVNVEPNLVTVRVYLGTEPTPHEFNVTLTGEGSSVYVARIDWGLQTVTACEPAGC